MAKKDGVKDEIIEALRNDKPIPDDKLEVLRLFAKSVAQKRGELSPEEVNSFLQAGYTRQHVLDVILTLAHKVMSNYTNHLAHTEVDAPFTAFKWDGPQK